MWRNPQLLILLAAGSMTTMAGGLVAPILPDIVKELKLDTGWAGMLVSMHCLTIALFSAPLGILADRVGRIRILIPCLLLYALVGVAGAFATNFWGLLLTRALLGAVSGGIAAASLGLLGSMYEGKKRSQALGLATSTLTITGITDPLLGGWVGDSNWRYSFYLYALAVPIAFLVAAIFKHESPLQAKAIKDNPTKSLRKVLTQPGALRVLLALSLTSVAMYAVVIYAPLYLKKAIAADSLLNGIVLASRAIGASVISAFGASKLTQLIGIQPTIALGFALMAATLATIPLLHQIELILVASIIFGVGFGIVLPSLYNALANFSPPELRSSVLAIGTGVGFLGQFMSPVLLGPVIYYSSLENVFYAAAIVALLTGVLLFVPQRR
ncbi:MFS transporter [Merismopedia glauca]|uniref:MFS transporter n=2 Tax=Merismopedia TaxID=53402 RepID=A0A2T1C613_9CYAN|nr:MFS transporter [Merismopedia glauca]PSB03701.1 MFS transporter [Merismopedia glauca CCAP 1448/3]